MRKSALPAVGWVLLGMVLMGMATWTAMPRLMLVDHISAHDYEQTISRLSTDLAARPDWRVLGVNDYQQSAAEFAMLPRVGSVNVCNPRYASRILGGAENRGVTAFMPLAIGVYEDDGGRVHVSRLNVGLVGMLFGGTIADVMGDAGTDLGRVVDAATAE